MYSLLIPSVIFILLCILRRWACATRAARTPRSFPPPFAPPSFCFPPHFPSQSLDLCFPFSHLLSSPFVHPTRFNRPSFFYPASRSNACRTQLESRETVASFLSMFRFRRPRVDVFNNSDPSLFPSLSIPFVPLLRVQLMYRVLLFSLPPDSLTPRTLFLSCLTLTFPSPSST